MKRSTANGKPGRTGNDDAGAIVLETAPVTRAIRAALAITATLFVLGGSSAAMAAGTCSAPVANTVSCVGAFTDTVPGANFTPTIDLTLILGDTAPTSVIPAFGAIGVDAVWGGIVNVTSFADITTVGATGVHAYGSTSAAFTNNGSISSDATGAPGTRAADISAFGDVAVINAGNMLASSNGVEDVTSVGAFSTQGNVSVTNQATGSVIAQAQDGNAIAIDASADLGTVTVDNQGAILASSVNGGAIGVNTLASAGDTQVTNAGTISATMSSVTGTYANAIGISATATAGATTVNNTGAIHATDVLAGYGGRGIGINATGATGVTVTNSGDIQTQGVGSYGIVAYVTGQTGTATVTNSAQGQVEVVGNAATGIRAGSASGLGAVTNAGSVTVDANYCGYFCYASATGIRATTVDNAGSIVVNQTSAAAFLGGVTAVSVTGYGSVDSSVTNTGSIVAYAASSHGGATGIVGQGGTGTVHVNNSGLIDVTGTGLYSFTKGINMSAAGDVDIVNTGDIEVNGGSASGIFMFSEGVGHVQNTGTIAVSGSSGQGISTYAAGLVENTGRITIDAYSSGFGISANEQTGALLVTNAGDIEVASGLQAHGINVYGLSYSTNAIALDNSGTIFSSTKVLPNTAYVPNTIGGAAYGVNFVNKYGTIALTNTGSITAELYSNSTFANGLGRYQSGAHGVIAYGKQDDIVLTNAGSISSTAENNALYFGARARGVEMTNDFGAADLSNSGSITATATSDFRSDGNQTLAEGVFSTNFRGDTAIDNSSSGSISATSSALLYNAAQANAINAYTGTGTIEVTNAGAISAVARSGATSAIGLYGSTTATGILVNDTFGPSASVGNAGSIMANASADHYGAAAATGIAASVYYGNSLVTNAGSIVATAVAATHTDAADAATATGISINGSSYTEGALTAFGGSAGSTITANATAELQSIATGVSLIGQNIQVDSSGAIHANAIADPVTGFALATGLSITGTQASVTLGSGSNIQATAQGSQGSAIGVLISSQNAVTASNAGTITASFNGSSGVTYGAIVASGGDLVFTNTGHISATQSDSAVALELSSPSSTALTNTGTITANAAATGAIAVLLGDATNAVDNGGRIDGAIIAGAGNDTLINRAGAVWNTSGSSNLGDGNNAITNAGAINGMIKLGSGDDTFTNAAGGSWTIGGTNGLGEGNNSIDNAGVIDGSITTGAGNDTVTNAAGALWTTGNASNLGDGNNTITNGGLIDGAVLTGSGNDTFVNLAGATWNTASASNLGNGNNTITNGGVINGSLQTGSGDDTFTNAIGGRWNATGNSAFGAGADTIANAGTIALDNATIALGGVFGNTGTVAVLGNNRIGADVFTNTGVLDFQNGSTADVLTIAGNFAGVGRIAVDASGVQNASDRLFVAGNVAADSVTTVNVNLLDLPTTANSSIPVVQVSGTATPASFVLGTVTQPLGFMSLAYGDSLIAGKDNLFSLGIAVTGLSDLGALASSVAPGAQSLMNSQVGTLQQRMGAVSQTLKGGVSLWTRVFDSQGTIDPSHGSNNFGQGGNYAFNQKNSGGEVGANIAVTDELRFGVLVAKSEGDQRLNGVGAGTSDITGHTFGGYATWIAPSGFYVDASYRRMNFDAKLRALGGETWSHGTANTFNVEVGQQWTVGNDFKIAPQVQFTHTRVDSSDHIGGAAIGFRSDGDDSSRGRIGVQFSKSFIAANGNAIWTPSFSVNAVREFDGKNRYSVNDSFYGETSTKGNSALAEVGIDGKFGPLSIYGGLNWQDGGALKNIGGGQLGLRYAW